MYFLFRTYSYGKIPTIQPSNTKADEDLIPVGLYAETLSPSEIRLSWVDPNVDTFNQYYTVNFKTRLEK